MRLNTYLTEASYTDAEVIASELQKECSQIISEYSKIEGFLLRGVPKKGPNSVLTVKNMRNERVPRDTPQHVHDWLNDEFESRFGWKVRNGVSTTSAWRTASGYGNGNVYVFFPTNGYKFCWSPAIQDLTLSLPSELRNSRSAETLAMSLKLPRYQKSMKQDYFGTYQEVNLEKGIKSGNEMLFNSPKYFLLAVNAGQDFRAVCDELFPNQGWANSDFQLQQWTTT